MSLDKNLFQNEFFNYLKSQNKLKELTHFRRTCLSWTYIQYSLPSKQTNRLTYFQRTCLSWTNNQLITACNTKQKITFFKGLVCPDHTTSYSLLSKQTKRLTCLQRTCPSWLYNQLITALKTNQKINVFSTDLPVLNIQPVTLALKISAKNCHIFNGLLCPEHTSN